MFPKQKSLVHHSFKGIYMYNVFNTIFCILEIRPKLCQCDDLHKLETFCNLYNLVQTHLKVAVLNIISN